MVTWSNNKIFYNRLLILIAGSIVIRLIVWSLLPPARELTQYADTEKLFFSAMTANFKDYFYFTTQIPPASYLINAAVFFVFGIKTAIHIRAFLLLVAIMNIVSVGLLFKTMLKSGVNSVIAFCLLGLFSTVLIPYELWRQGMHYDHYTIFFTSLFVWSLAGLIKEEDNIPNQLWVAVAGGLLVSQSAVNSAVVPFSIILILLFLFVPKKKYRKLFGCFIITVSLPLIALVLISKKNLSVGQVSLTSNKGGPAMMMVVQRAYNYDVKEIRSLMKESGAPDWYLWTYDHATKPIDPKTGKGYEHWINLAQAFGICFFSTDSSKGKGTWQFNFDPLIYYLKKNGPANLISSVEADADDAVNRPYRFAGYSPELSPRWIGIYGDVSKKIFFKAILKNPVGMFRAFFMQQGIFCIYGPLFTYNTISTKPNLLARSGLRTLPTPLPLAPFFTLVTLLFAMVAWLIYLLAIINFPIRLVQLLRSVKPNNTDSQKLFFLLSIPLITLAVVFSCLVGGENDRYFMQVTPYIVVLAGLATIWLKSTKNQPVV